MQEYGRKIKDASPLPPRQDRFSKPTVDRPPLVLQVCVQDIEMAKASAGYPQTFFSHVLLGPF